MMKFELIRLIGYVSCFPIPCRDLMWVLGAKFARCEKVASSITIFNFSMPVTILASSLDWQTIGSISWFPGN